VSKHEKKFRKSASVGGSRLSRPQVRSSINFTHTDKIFWPKENITKGDVIAYGIGSFVKTSGKTGTHLMVPLGAAYTYLQARNFAKLLAQCANRTMPDLTTLEQRLAKRKGRIYIDIARNALGQTTASVYSLRPYPAATVSAPLEWKEVKKGLRPSQFTIKTILPRLKKKGDLFRHLLMQTANLEKATKILKV